MTHEAPDPGGSPGEEPESEHVEDMLDEAGKESFPASDPVAVTPPRHSPAPGHERAHDADRNGGGGRDQSPRGPADESLSRPSPAGPS